MKENEEFFVTLEQVADYQFQAAFEHVPSTVIYLDEDHPLGSNRGPNAARLLAASIGYCLSASLMFCLGKSRITVRDMETRVKGRIVRNNSGRLRVGEISVEMQIDVNTEDKEKAARCLGLFEDYCTVTATLRRAINIDVVVREMISKEILFTHKTTEPLLTTV